jgi:NAD(P)H-flavin reductase/hemoglobin-like flavoprotein
VASIGPGSGQQNLLALLRAIRLKNAEDLPAPAAPVADPPDAPVDTVDISHSPPATRPGVVPAAGPVPEPGAEPDSLPVPPRSAPGAGSGAPATDPADAAPATVVPQPGGRPGAAVPGGAVPGGAVPGGAVPGGAVPGAPVPGAPVPGGGVPGQLLPVPGGQAPVPPGTTPVPGTTPAPGTNPAPAPGPNPGTALPPAPGTIPVPGTLGRPPVPGLPLPLPAPPQPPQTPGQPVPQLPVPQLPQPPGTLLPVLPTPGTPPPGTPQPGNPQPVNPQPVNPQPVTPLPAAPLPPGLHGLVPALATHGPVPPRSTTGPPVDGTSPADDAVLRELQRLLSTSLTLAGGIDDVVVRLRDALVMAVPQLVTALPGSPESQREQLRAALTWLVDNLDHPPVMAAGCGQLGAALREFGVQPQQLQLMGAALAEAMRAGMGNAWRQDYDTAWRTTWQLAHRWITHGADAARYEPITYLAVVVGHERRRSDLAVLRLRPYLPMPFRPGQYARVEVAELPGIWRPYSLAGAPRTDNVLELHVRAKGESGVSGTLVHRTAVGDLVRLTRAEGAMALPEISSGTAGRDLLMIAGDTGVAPLKALLTELAATGDERSAVLFWGARTLEELYDIEEIAAVARACRRATVIPVISQGDPGPYAAGLVTDAVAAYGEWSGHEVFLAGPPPMLAATIAVLIELGIEADRIHHDAPDA